MTSYVNTRLGLPGRLKELVSLYSPKDTERHLQNVLNQARDIQARLEQLTGRSLDHCKILEIGAGQQLIQLTYFNLRAEAIGVDMDVVPDHRSFTDYLQMWRVNGTLRTFKTLARKALRVDNQVRAHLKKQLGVAILPRPSVQQMDASAMSFPDERFDAIYSRAVFEHLLDPGAVLREIRRVLKPGGAAVIYLHLYTSDTGCHDVRTFAQNRAHIPYWSHLRPQHRHLINENTVLNRLRLAEWRALFATELPGSVVFPHCDAEPKTRQALQYIRSAGELSSYADEELLSVTVEAFWSKPARAPLPSTNPL